MSTPPTLAAKDVRRTLARAILTHADACDEIRDNTAPHSASEYQQAATALAENLAALAALDAVWRALFPEEPSILAVHQAALD